MMYREQGRRNGSFYYHVGDGYHYKLERATDTQAYFVCHHFGCHGRAVYRANGVFEHSQMHFHPPDVLYTDVQEARRNILAHARSLTYVSFADIIAGERSRIPNREVRMQLTLRRLRPAMLRRRREIFPNLPDDLAGLTAILRNPAYEWLTKSKDFQDRMYLGSTWSADGSHNVIFMSSRCLQIMRLTSIIFADGTFYIAPSVDGCYQVFTLVTISNHTVIPLCWCLMERKTEHAYVAVLLLIRQQLMHWNFRRVVSDFEDAIINAFRYVFQIEVQGCYFHSVNAMGVHARLTIGIQILHYFPEIKNIVRLCCVLPLLQQHLIQRGFEIIGEMAMEELNIFLYTCFARPYLEYIQYEWLYHATRGPTLSVSGSEHRTNNARGNGLVFLRVEYFESHQTELTNKSESNNRRMKRSIGVHHPNIYHFIRHLVDFEDMALDNFNSLTGAILPNRHRNHESISNDAYITAITTQLMVNNNPNDEQILTFLISAAVTLEDMLAELFH